MISRPLSLFLLAACMGTAGAQTPPPDSDSTVEVSAIRNPDLKKYRSLLAGVEMFEDKRADYAPKATDLRFRFWPRHRGGKDDPLANLQLRLVGEGDGEPIPVPVAADGTFVLPRSERAYDENADLILNRKKGELRGFPYVRTPGLPATTRRLGDHRLECRVVVAVAKKDIGLLLTATINTLLLTTDWCSSSKGHWGMDSEYELDGATLRDGARTEELKVHGRSYEIPMGDMSWSNDALIELHPAPPPTAEELATPFGRPMFVMGTMNDWGTGARLVKVDEGLYRAQFKLSKRRHEFKIGARGFEGIDLGGAAAGEVVKPGVPVTLAAKGRNLVLQPEREGSYIFLVDVRDESAPKVTVTAD